MKQHKLLATAYSLLPIAVGLSTANTAFAKETETLNTINVDADINDSKANYAEKKNAKIIQQELIENNKDLVRYSPDVGVVDQGRHQKGFAIRGVEDNRVGISVDGVALPDSEENSLYKRYGNLNTSRQSIDPELARTIEIVKGADSFNQGSGNIGGGVNYRTLEPFDIVREGKQFGVLYRTGYASRNTEWVNTLGVAYTGEKAEALLLYSNRRGHEMKSAGGYTIPEDSLMTRYRSYGKQTPDDSKHNNHSYLAKLTYQFNDHHRVGVSYSGQHNKNYIIEDSAITLPSRWREADDRAKRGTFNVFYEYLPDSKIVSLIKVDADYQKTTTSAYNYEGYRAQEATPWRAAKPAEPSDTNLRFFNTKFKRINLQIDSQPFDLWTINHRFSLKTAFSERKFDVLHQDAYYLSGAWVKSKDSTMMHPVKTRHHYVSLYDSIEFTPEWKGHFGVRYDWAKYAQQGLGNLECRNCFKNDDAKFHNLSWTTGIEKQFNNDWKIAYSIGSGFRMPNASEMYFDYRNNAAGAWMSNPSLKAERSLTQNLNLKGDGRLGNLSANLHHSRYKNFLYEQEIWEQYTVYGRTNWRPVQQMQNIDSAKIYGFELTGKLNLNEVTPLPNGWKLFGSLGYSKGNLSNGADLLSVQPIKAVVGLDYEQPNGKWGIFSRLTYLGAKKAKDAKYIKTLEERCLKQESRPNPYWPYWGTGPTEISCTEYSHETGLDTWKHLNSKAFVFDMFGFYKPVENITLRAGIYNLFNRKYHTWDTLRGLNDTGGVVNSVGKRENSTFGGYPGLERYYQPGRNFAASVEIRF